MKVSIVLALSALLLVGCATTFVVPEMDVGLGDMPADPATFIELDSGIVLHQMDGEAVNKSGPLRIHCTPGPHELMVSYHAEWVVNGVRYTRSSGGALPLTVNVNEGQPRFVMDRNTADDRFEPESERYSLNDYGQDKRKLFMFRADEDSPVAMLDADTLLYGRGSTVYLSQQPAAGAEVEYIKLHDFSEGKVLAVSTDGIAIWALCSDGTMVVLNAEDLSVLSNVSLGVTLVSAEFAGDMVYASVSDGGLGAWTLEGRRTGYWEAPGSFDEVAKRGGFLSANRDDLVVVVNIETGESREFPFGKDRVVRDARVDGVGNQLIVLFESQTFEVYDLATGSRYEFPWLRMPMRAQKPMALDISDDFTRLIITTDLFPDGGRVSCRVLMYELSPDPSDRPFYSPGKFGANESWAFEAAFPRNLVYDERTERIVVLGSAGYGPMYYVIRGAVFEKAITQ